MYFVKIDDRISEYIFKTKKDAVIYIADELERENFDDPIQMLKDAEKVKENNKEIIITDKRRFTIFTMHEYVKCCICSEAMTQYETLECKHSICNECISKLRKNECPVCRSQLSGVLLTDEVLSNILQRTEIDEHEERQHDEMMAFAAQLGFNPNELY